MTDRERWTVYPLLLLSLAISLRSHITQTLDLREISCHTLRCDKIVGKEPDTPCDLLLCKQISTGDIHTQRMFAQAVEVVGSDGKPRLLLSVEGEKGTDGGAVRVLSPQGSPGVVIGALPNGGVIEVVAPVDARHLRLRTINALGDRVQIAGPPTDQSKAPAAGSEEKPGEEKPATPETSETRGKPAEPSSEKPEAGKPEAKPEAEKPADDKPAADKPADEKPADEKPAADDE